MPELHDAAPRRDTLTAYASRQVPRYTSYPTANVWGPIGEGFARAALGRGGGTPLSLYVHVPFCKQLCFYCGCNMLVSRNPALYARYLAALEQEAVLVAAALPSGADVVQVHLGGGTPTALDSVQLTALVSSLQRHFPFERGVEASIEVHPAVTSVAQLATLAGLGFNRVSMGVQDFDPEVQQRINRPQPFEQTRDLIVAARELGFVSVNVDLMYGLPLQTPAKLDLTLDRLAEIRPDRVALFGYAHMPSLKKHHRAIVASELPQADGRIALFTRAIERLEGLGYVSIGLDHFALPGDELCRARAAGTLRRNFMGYTTCAQSDVVALGPSSISEVGDTFVQNERDVYAWAKRVESGRLPVVRGWRSSDDDRLRADVIQRLFCDLEIDVAALSSRHGVDFARAFARELRALEALARDGLLVRDAANLRVARFRVTPSGQLLLRNIAAVFDRYLDARQHSAAV
jgi:oxygen-independent coproporphyrinogen-3 oxidase